MEALRASLLLRALDEENDEAVQRTIYAALGKVASADAVQRLIAVAKPARGLFRRKSSALRAAATTALGEAATPAALAALRSLADDREDDVREAALRGLSAARRSREPQVTEVFDATRDAGGRAGA
jgi:HEAT repeat protein